MVDNLAPLLWEDARPTLRLLREAAVKYGCAGIDPPYAIRFALDDEVEIRLLPNFLPVEAMTESRRPSGAIGVCEVFAFFADQALAAGSWKILPMRDQAAV